MQVVVSGFVDVECENEILVFLNVTGPHSLVRPGLFRISHRLPINIRGMLINKRVLSKRIKRKKGLKKSSIAQSKLYEKGPLSDCLSKHTYQAWGQQLVERHCGWKGFPGRQVKVFLAEIIL